MLAAVFPGQGSQKVGMAQAFYESSPAAKAVLDEAESALPGLLETMWQGPIERLTLTENQQPALVAAAASAYAAYLEAGGRRPDILAGHSLGEFSAHVAAGSLSVAQAVTLVHKRGRYMQEAVPEGRGAMAAVMKLAADAIEEIVGDIAGAEIANYNGDGQTVISGEAEAIALAVGKLQEAGARAIPLNVSAPFHCSLMQSAADRLAQDLANTNFAALQLPIVANVSARAFQDASQAHELLSKQVTSPVRWTESVREMRRLGVDEAIEFGSGKVLSGLIKRIDKSVAVRAIENPEDI